MIIIDYNMGQSQQLKAFSPMFVTESGMVIDVNPLQPLKANLPIVITELGIVTEVIKLQKENAQSPIVVTEFGMIMLPAAVGKQPQSFVLVASLYTKNPST